MIGFGQINFFLNANGGINGLYNSAAIAYSDVDNDGDNDVLITGNFQAQLYINNGIGIFDTSGVPPMFPLADNGSIAFADIDNDGHQDVLITGESSGQINSELYRNDGTSYFVLINGTPFTGVNSSSVAFADIDNDGDEDLLITGDVGANDFIGLYKNDGSGNFTALSGISLCGSIEGGINFLDFDGDSDLDLIITGLTYNCSSGTGARTILYKNDGAGVFTEDPSHPFWAAELSSTSFGDIDGDNDMDIIVSGWDGAGASFTNLGINDGAGNFTLVTGGGGIVEVRNSSVTFADLDNDSDQDLIISGEDDMGQNKTLVYSNDGTGNFTEVQNLNLVAPTNPVFVCVDIDGDADLDIIIVGDNSTSVYINAPGVYGCTDYLACNYDSLATIDDSSCIYPVIWYQTYLICDGDSISVGNNIYDTAGVYMDTLNTFNGCDSIIHTYLMIDENTSSYDTLSVTASIVWNGMSLNVSGDYSVTLINSVGCDSIANLNLTVTATGISDIVNIKSNLVKITDVLGQETPYRRNTPLFYIYDDGTVEKRIIIE
jgi:hypothetical protein